MRAGQLALEAGTAGGADVTLIPEILYQVLVRSARLVSTCFGD
jgi:6-phosphofructokinase